MDFEKLPPEFYLQDTLTVARELLGKRLVHVTPEGTTSCFITETEAYLGATDKAAHSYRASPDGRTNIMYQVGGHAYVYLIYGMYCCFNVTARPAGIGEAVLIRSGEPELGIDLMFQRRQAKKLIRSLTEHTLLTGPGKLCIAFGIDRSQYGLPLWGDELFLCQGREIPSENIAATKRINIDYAEEAVDFPYRFIDKTSLYLSVKPKKQTDDR